MYEVSDIQDYLQKWLEAERELLLMWLNPRSTPPNDESIDADATGVKC